MATASRSAPTSGGSRLTEKTPIMLLTARATVQDRVAGYNAGADDYVVKPFDARLFHARIRLLARIKGIQTRDA